jgi:hypothetical protein
MKVVSSFSGRWTSFFATAYSIELEFFDEYLFRRLGEAPLNATVLTDAGTHGRLWTSGDPARRLRRANRDYLHRSKCRRATTAPRDGPSHATDPAAKPQLTRRDRPLGPRLPARSLRPGHLLAELPARPGRRPAGVRLLQRGHDLPQTPGPRDRKDFPSFPAAGWLSILSDDLPCTGGLSLITRPSRNTPPR